MRQRPSVGPKGGSGTPSSSQNGNGDIPLRGDEGDGTARAFQIMANAMMSRLDLVRGISPDARKDIYDSCHLPAVGQITPDMYWNMFDREPVAARAVEVLPKESWQVQPLIYEAEESDQATAFEEAWDNLGTQLRGKSYYKDEEGNPVFEYLLRADILSRVGQYGLLVIGINDGKRLEDPAEIEHEESSPIRKLVYLRTYPQQHAKIVEWDTDENSLRYGYPTMYEVQENSPTSLTNVTGVAAPSQPKRVHWTRCVHLCDGGDIFAPETMRSIFNNLYGIQKISCSSPEMYWRGAFPGIGFSTIPQLGASVKINYEKLQDMMEKYYQDLQRHFVTWGLQAQQFTPQVVDPSPYIAAQIELICIRLGIPIRVFKGSERGELASTQDDAAWNDRLKLRQKYYLTPKVIVPFVDRLIGMGVLPKPEQFSVYWPDLTSQTDEQKATVATLWMDFYSKYIKGEVQNLVSPLDVMTRYGNLSEEEATSILEASAEHMVEVEEKEAEKADEAIKRMQETGGSIDPKTGNPIPAPASESDSTEE